MKTHEISILKLRACRNRAEVEGGEIWDDIVKRIDDSVKATSAEKLIQEKVDVPESLILEAHKEACVEWKCHIENNFPDVFKKDEYFNFGKEYTISTRPSHKEHPFTIGDGWCECHDEKRYTSLFINSKYWEMETSKSSMEGHDMIKLRFKKKKNG